LTLRPGQRPLRLKSGDELKGLFQDALAKADGVAGAHCIHERWMRGDFAAHIEADLELLWKSAGPSIPDWLPMRYISWLPAAYEVSARFAATGRGHTNVYLILLDFTDRRGVDHGVYVGMSRYPAAQRFDQHKAGIRAAGAALNGNWPARWATRVFASRVDIKNSCRGFRYRRSGSTTCVLYHFPE
jgi:hypothetical protein